MSVLTETKLLNGVVPVASLPEGDVLDTIEVICCSCDEIQPLSTMHYDFEDEQFICKDCAKEITDE